MPYNELKLAELTTTCEEYIDKDEIAKRLGVVKRTVERLIEAYRKKLKHWRRRGKVLEYLWSDILKCAKIHKGIENENVPSVAIKRACMKQRIKDHVAEAVRLINENDNQLNSKRTS